MNELIDQLVAYMITRRDRREYSDEYDRLKIAELLAAHDTGQQVEIERLDDLTIRQLREIDKLRAELADKWHDDTVARLKQDNTQLRAELADSELRHLQDRSQQQIELEKLRAELAWWKNPQSYHLFPDGDQFCAVRGDFQNLQESPSAFAETPRAALGDLFCVLSETKEQPDV